MLIDAIELFHLSLEHDISVLVRLESSGVSGWGEACPGREPVDSPEWAGGVFACLRDFLAPAVRGQSIATGDELQERLARFQGNAIAKSALDMAWWNLQAQLQNTSLTKLVGGTREKIETSVTLDVMESEKEMLDAVGPASEQHALVLLKFRPGWGEAMLRGVRQAFPAIPLAIDCDGLVQLGQREMFYRLDDFMLRWIEQPFAADDLVVHAMMQEGVRTPICLHQSIFSAARAEQATDLKSCRAVKLDPSLAGGLTTALAIYQECKLANLPMAIGGRCATNVGAGSLRALATLEGISLPSELGNLPDIDVTPLVDSAVARIVI
jgi:O-succinylbenzoate synthase